MKSVLHLCSAAFVAACLSSCTSVHPLPDDVTDNTVTIVQKVRCEARDAVMMAIVRYLRQSVHDKDRRFAERLASDPTQIYVLIDDDTGVYTSKDALKYLNQYYGGAIAYSFDLDIQREADNGISINLIDAFTNSDRKYDIGGGVKREQKARRQFQISDKFIDLANLYMPDRDGRSKCPGKPEVNYAYPISGTVGLEETVSTFLTLNDMAGIQQAASGGVGVTRFTDELVFTTTLTGRLNPKIVFDPVGIGGNSPDAGLTNSYKRVDKHQVTVSIEVPLLPEAALLVSEVAKTKRISPTLKRATKAELQALENLDYQYNLNRTKTLYDAVDRFE